MILEILGRVIEASAVKEGATMDARELVTPPNGRLQEPLFATERGTNAITAEGLVKIYRSRKQEVRALDGLDLASQRLLSLKDVKVMVLDEADKMLDLGFLSDIEKLFAQTSPTRHTMPCSWSVEMSTGRPRGWASDAFWMPFDRPAIWCGSRVLWAQVK